MAGVKIKNAWPLLQIGRPLLPGSQTLDAHSMRIALTRRSPGDNLASLVIDADPLIAVTYNGVLASGG